MNNNLNRFLSPDYAWLNLTHSDIDGLSNPLIRIDEVDFERPDLHLMRLLRNPHYFHLTCKYILNLELLPLSALVLQELWMRPFPMLVASRGFGKSWLLSVFAMLKCLLIPGAKVVICGAGLRQSKVIFEYMENIWRNAPVLRSLFTERTDGPNRDVDRCIVRMGESFAIAIPIGDGCLAGDTLVLSENGFKYLSDMIINEDGQIWDNSEFGDIVGKINNGIKPTLRIVSKKGFQLCGTHNHEIRRLENNSIVWTRLDKLKIGDKILIDVKPRWHSGKTNVTKDQAYALGLMLGDGSWTNHYLLRYATKDYQLIEALEKGTGLRFIACKDGVHFNHPGKKTVTSWKKKWGFSCTYTKNKYIPNLILASGQEEVVSCLQGLFDTDGHVQLNTHKGGMGIKVGFTNTSEKLVTQIQFILLHFGIISTISNRKRKNWNKVFELHIYGRNVKIFADKIGFRLRRKQESLLFGISQKTRWPSQEQYFDNFFVDEISLVYEAGMKETFDVEVANIHQYNANGIVVHNSKIRGLRAHTVIADEFASISPQVYETVIQGFTSVSANPVDNVKAYAKRKRLIKEGIWNSELEGNFIASLKSNQSIITGTADYGFKHFAGYFKKYKNIIESNGDSKIIEELHDGDVPPFFNWKDYSIIRIPYELIPEGVMDDKAVSRAKAMLNSAVYNLEYSACFIDDSDGFFKRSLIESCVVSDVNPITLPSGRVLFNAATRGTLGRKYVYAIDPASEVDNFTICILELWEDHTRIVYMWSTNKKNFKDRQKAGLTQEGNYYSFCARKVRDLMKTFHPVEIAMDSQGGGYAVLEAFHDADKIYPGEQLIWEIKEEGKEKDSDCREGLHIVRLINFADSIWVSQANHWMRKDFEDKVLLFPQYDNVSLGLAIEEDVKAIKSGDKNMLYDTNKKTLYDSLEDCVWEIEQLKNELSIIIMTSTGISGRDRWDTPETKTAAGTKGKLRKDRYSALLMANRIAHDIGRTDIPPTYKVIGGSVKEIADTIVNKSGPMYESNGWYYMDPNIGTVVNKQEN